MEATRAPLGTKRRASNLRLLAAFGAGLILTSFIPGPAGGAEEEEFIRGSGQSYAQIYRVGPTAGRLSLAPIFGLSLADYLNTVARGETKAADWAGIGVAECSLPENTPTLKVSSTQEGAEEGTTEYAAGQSDGTNGGGIGELYARATKAPFGESRYRMATMSIPGLIEVRDSEAYTSTGIVDTPKGKVREATAETEIGTLVFGGGAVVLKGMRWSTVQQTGAVKGVKGTFTIEGATIGGVPLAFPAGTSDLKAVLDPINAAIAPTGFAISLPEVESRSGQANVSPLSIDIINSPAGRQFLAPILEALHPAREAGTDAFIELAKLLVEAGNVAAQESEGCGGGGSPVPDLTVAVLAADLTLGIFSGSSQLHLEFGGVSAFTEGETFDNPFDDVNFKPPNLGVAPTTVVTPGRPGTPGVEGTDPTDVAGNFESAPLPPGSRTVRGDKGGVALAVGLIGLAVAIALAAADWWRMRRSRLAEGA